MTGRTDDVAYSQLQSTKPQTLAFGLTDSPAALAAWVVDLFRSFSDTGGDIESGISRRRILANLTVWWANATIGAAMRGDYDFAHVPQPPPPGERIEVPAGFAVFADSYRHNAVRTPRELAEGSFRIERWTEMERGGHFAALHGAGSARRGDSRVLPPAPLSVAYEGSAPTSSRARSRALRATRISRGPMSPTASPAPAPTFVCRCSQGIPSVRSSPQIAIRLERAAGDHEVYEIHHRGR